MNHFFRTLIGVSATVAVLVSCRADVAHESEQLLQYIPAETPYVMAFTKPLPDDLMDKFEPVVDQTLSGYERILRYKVSEVMVELSREEGGAEKAKQLQELVDEFTSLMSVQGLRDAGIDRDSVFAIYGDGLLPVFRIELSDRDKFDATVSRLESKSPQKFQVGTVGGESYRYYDIEEARFVVATPGDSAVITIVPSTYSDERLARALGIKKPQDNVADGLEEIRNAYDFTDHFVGFVDVEKLAASFLGDPSGLNKELLLVAEHDPEELMEECRAEFAELASVAPRVVVGYTNVNKSFLDTRMVVELREDIASGLATLPTAVPGLGADLGGLLSFGFSLDPMAARSFLEARLDAMEADPFECADLGELQASVAQGRQALAQPLPPVVYNFSGMLAHISDVQGMNLGTKKPPESVDASFLVAFKNAQDLVNMASMMIPQVAEMNLLPDGKARALDLPQLAEIADKAFVALSNVGISVAMGEGSAENSEAMLVADVEMPPPFVSFSMDSKRYYDFVGDALMQENETEDGESEPLALRTAMRDVMVSSGELYERVSVNVHLTERGVEIGSRMTLSD
ncbi:MAG: hypothetical protein OEQ16_03575 [Gammaproteobacteria bacterium]|nr:hypothetical protein [Gammaproteobacteria bacterium]